MDTPTAHRPGLWRHGLRTMLAVDRAQLQPLRGLRLALGVAIPLVGGAAAGHADIGAFASAGALGVGFGGFLGTHRTQAATMFAAAASIAASLFVGSLAGDSTAITAGLVVLWAFGAGLLGVFGPAAYFVGLQSVLHLLLGSGFPSGLHDASLRALVAFAGGALQTSLVVGVWPFRRFVAERNALSGAYRSLARYLSASTPVGTPPPSLAASGIHAVLADPYPFANHGDVSTLQRLLDEAEQIRVSLAAVDGADASLRAAVASVLNEIADALQAGRAPAQQAQAWSVLESAGTARRSRATGGAAPGTRSVGSVHMRRLLGQLRAAWRIATDGTADDAIVLPDSARATRPPALGAAARTLRAALSTDSSAFRHALRIAIAVALATALERTTKLPNGYWLPIAVLLVLQPGFGDTMTRGLGMMTGTVAGALAATLIAAVLRPEQWTLTWTLAVIAWLCFTTFRANYAIFAACITAYVVFLVSFFGLPEPVAALHRVFATLAGGLLALAAYALWPTWEARLVSERLAAALDAQARYAAELFVQFGSSPTVNDAALAKARLRAQLERSNAETSVERMLVEPGSRALAPSTALGILAAVRTFALAGLVLDGARPEAACPPSPRLRALAKGIEQGLGRVAAALRSGTPSGPMPPLRALHARFGDELAEHAAPSANRGECLPLQRLALSETDLMVDSVDTIASLVSAAGPRL